MNNEENLNTPEIEPEETTEYIHDPAGDPDGAAFDNVIGLAPEPKKFVAIDAVALDPPDKLYTEEEIKDVSPPNAYTQDDFERESAPRQTDNKFCPKCDTALYSSASDVAPYICPLCGIFVQEIDAVEKFAPSPIIAQKPVMESISSILPRVPLPSAEIEPWTLTAEPPKAENATGAPDAPQPDGNLPELEPSFVDLAGEPPEVVAAQSFAPSQPFFPQSALMPFSQTGLAQRTVNELAPIPKQMFEMGDFDALGFVLPDKVRGAIVKSQLPKDQVMEMLEQYQEAYRFMDGRWAKFSMLQVANEFDTDTMREAGEERKLAATIRITLDKRRKVITAGALLFQQTANGLAMPMIEDLKKLEDAYRQKEEFALNLAKGRKRMIAEDRANKLRAFNAAIPQNLADIDDATWELIYNGAVSAYHEEEARKQRVAADAEVERQRLIRERREADERAALATKRAVAAEASAATGEAEKQRQADFERAEAQRVAALSDSEKMQIWTDSVMAIPFPPLESVQAKAFFTEVYGEIRIACSKMRGYNG